MLIALSTPSFVIFFLASFKSTISCARFLASSSSSINNNSKPFFAESSLPDAFKHGPITNPK